MLRKSLRILIALCCVLSPATAQAAKETEEEFAVRTRWWREARFGMFIHWGIYAVPADSTDLNGRKVAGEWYFNNKQAQVKDYEKFAAQFDPVRFDARQWVRTAKDAGMRYIVITSKHHDGFCMFDSALTDYCITKATPFKRDPMKELAAECRRQGVKFCFYHSIMDWHHPDYLPRRKWDTRPVDGASLDRYLDYMKGELRELLTNYGPIGILWWDGGWEHNAQELHSEAVNALVRSLQPAILINDRDHLAEDYSTPEQTIPAHALPNGRLWETCMTLNDTWGYAKNDTNWKSTSDLVRKLCDITSKGGNFLLNVGPTAEGVFPDAINERLAGIGAWMKTNGRCIYRTTKSPFRKLAFNGRCTARGNRLYLEVFEWPGNGLKLAGLKNRVLGARALAGREKLRFETDPGTDPNEPPVLSISRPTRLDPMATVIELRLTGEAEVSEQSLSVQPQPDGNLRLMAVDAEVHGQTAHYEQGGGKDNIGFWTDPKDYITWSCRVPTAGRYRVEIVYACTPENEGSQFTVGPDGAATISDTVKATGSWSEFRTRSLGELELAAGSQTITVRVTSMPHGAVMNLQAVRLTR